LLLQNITQGGKGMVSTFFSLLPVVIAAVIIFAKLDFAVEWINRAGEWAERTRQAFCEKQKTIWTRVVLLGVGGLYRLFKWTDGITNAYVKSGIRFAAGIYFVEFFIFMVFYSVVTILALAAVLFILFLILDNAFGGGSTTVISSGSGSRHADHYDKTGKNTGRSDSRTGFFGNTITDHSNKSGQQTGHSETRDGVFTDKVTDHYDKSGQATGHGETREGVFGGQVTDEYDSSGNKIGYSITRQGALGNTITDHYDNSGNQIGHSES
jgi:hypothetical protein